MELPNTRAASLPGKALPIPGSSPSAANAGAFASDLAQFMAGTASAMSPAPKMQGEALPGTAAEDGATSGVGAAEGIADSIWAALGLVPLNPQPAAPATALPGGLASESVDGAASGVGPSRFLTSAAPTMAGPADAALRKALASAPGAESTVAGASPSGFNAVIAAAGAATTAAAEILPEALPRCAPELQAAGATPASPSAAAFTLPMLDRLGTTVAPAPAAVIVDPRLPQAPQQLAETLVWNIEKGVQQVQIHVHPADLGPINVNIRMEGDHVDVRFDAADAGVRDVVQTSLPQLASLLAARGLTLDQAQVFSQSRGGQQNPLPQPERREGDSGSGDASFTPRRVVRRGLVDDYV